MISTKQTVRDEGGKLRGFASEVEMGVIRVTVELNAYLWKILQGEGNR